VSNRDGNFEIYVMNNDGSNQVCLTNDSAYDMSPLGRRMGQKLFLRVSGTVIPGYMS